MIASRSGLPCSTRSILLTMMPTWYRVRVRVRGRARVKVRVRVRVRVRI